MSGPKPIPFEDWIGAPNEQGCREWNGGRSWRYGVYHVAGQPVRAHRHAWAVANGPIPEGMHVLHCCDNPPCVEVSHLFLGTNADNVADKVAKGRQNARRGEMHHNAKLTAAAVDQIRSSSASSAELAPRYNVSPRTIRKIRQGIRWGWAA